MKSGATHEPEAKLMNAADVWNDARQIATLLQQNASEAEPVLHLQIPLASFLSALDNLTRDELLALYKHLEERLAA